MRVPYPEEIFAKDIHALRAIVNRPMDEAKTLMNEAYYSAGNDVQDFLFQVRRHSTKRKANAVLAALAGKES